jgi:hypothetical protein
VSFYDYSILSDMEKDFIFGGLKLMQNIINIRHCPEWLERAADYFSSRWNIDR